MPVAAVRALVSVCLLWSWWSMAGCILLGFCGMLRPVAWLAATRRCLLLPQDLLEPDAMYVSILAPKTRRVYRRQHVKIDEKAVVGGVRCRQKLGCSGSAQAPSDPAGMRLSSPLAFRRSIFATPSLRPACEVLARRLCIAGLVMSDWCSGEVAGVVLRL